MPVVSRQSIRLKVAQTGEDEQFTALIVEATYMQGSRQSYNEEVYYYKMTQ